MASTPLTLDRILASLSTEFDTPSQVLARFLELREEGWGIPYLSRYRREELGGLDEARMFQVDERVADLRLLEERKTVLVERAAEAGEPLDDEQVERLLGCHDLAILEELYASYRPTRKGAAADALRRGLGPLARKLMARDLADAQTPLDLAAAEIDAAKGLPDALSVLEGAKAILRAEISPIPELREALRNSPLRVKLTGKGSLPPRLQRYAKHPKPARQIPWRDFLALKAGVWEKTIELDFAFSEEAAHQILSKHYCASDDRGASGDRATSGLGDASDPLRNFFDSMLREAWAYELAETMKRDILKELKEDADRHAIRQIAESYEKLLMQSPVGARRVCGVLPAIRKATRFAVVDEKGYLVARLSLYPGKGDDEAPAKLRAFLAEHDARILALGSGPGCREVETFLLAALAEGEQRPEIIAVDESGTSFLSRPKGGSKHAAARGDRHDPGVQKAAVLARRLQDPLAQWTRVDPEHAPLGEATAQVHQALLHRKLADVRLACLHRVGLDFAHAPAEALACINGIDREKAGKIVALRRKEGGVPNLAALVTAGILDERAYEQAAPFLRHSASDQPLDATRINPGRYDLVESMAASLGISLRELCERPGELDRIQLSVFERADAGKSTLKSVLSEMRTPWCDPREPFEPLSFDRACRRVGDLEMGMRVKGRVARLSDFGAFVDIGIDTIGLLHVSQISSRRVYDITRVLEPGQVLDLRVLEADSSAHRVSLTMLPGDIQKVQRTLGDFADGRRKPGAVVVSGGDTGGDTGGDRRRAFASGSRGGAARSGTAGSAPSRGRAAARPERDERGRGGPRRPGARDQRGGSDRDRGGFGRDRRPPGKSGSTWVVESEDIKQAEAEDRGLKGELKSFGALASTFGAARGPSESDADEPEDRDEPSKAPSQSDEPGEGTQED